ncbi:MAG: hypothetical protein AB8B63_00150 [Granulosicoccus sp.]
MACISGSAHTLDDSGRPAGRHWIRQINSLHFAYPNAALTEMLDSLTSWVAGNGLTLLFLALVSCALLVITLFATPWLVSRLPSDYLLAHPPPLLPYRWLRILIALGRNILALILLTLGLIMLVTPGPGLVMLLLAASIAQVPGKQWLVRRFATHEPVFNSLNWMRRRYGKPPFLHPGAGY